MSIALLRHGDTGQRSYRGQLDDPLTELGWMQLREAVKKHVCDRIVTSSMARCARFAEELADERGVPWRIDARLAEYHFGDWQGVPIETLAEEQGDALGRFWADPVAHPPPGAETFDAFHARLAAAMDDVSKEMREEYRSEGTHVAHAGRDDDGGYGYGDGRGNSDNGDAKEARVLVITHGGAIRLLRCAAERRPFGDMANIDVPHASLHAITWGS